MIKEGKIGTMEAISISTIFLTTKAFYINPGTVIKLTGTAGWYTTQISVLGSVLLFMIVYLLMKRFPGNDLINIFDIVTGRFLGKIFSLIFCGFFVYYSGISIREFVEMIKAYILPYTPPSAIIFLFIGVVLAYAYVGLEGIARMGYISFIVILIGLILILVLPSPYYEIDNIFPMGGYGLGASIQYGLLRTSAYSEVIFLAFIVKPLQGIKNFKKVGLLSLLFAGIIIGTIILCSLLAFEYPQGGENLSALFQLSRIVYFSRFFQRIETIFIFIWVMASVITVSLTFYLSVSTFCKTFRISKHRPYLLPFAFFTFLVTLLPENISEIVQVHTNFLRSYSMFIVYLIPILVLLIAIIRGKKGVNKEGEKV
ncbi:spore germination protein [Pseudobacteroides cellulosolvens ATCC 35603 = DSM 2933]|uniref:Spore germination protein n=2 Tax=Pseudobacteroides cellulosolvens TaxID=35825 RepID=A0A0L6JT15_9FIRM|nr:endospore germination permease [Pseudobacteroides cellulosolvens]KNY28834.1 spore germination protein [Pseudobacteroides cellulosolvens ATCC 35603 = DSM 2933]